MVIDNTNPTATERAKYIRRAKEAGYQVVGYFMQSRLQECIARNELREGKGKIPSKAIVATSNRLELLSYQEGFDKLYYVSMTDHGIELEEWRDTDGF